MTFALHARRDRRAWLAFRALFLHDWVRKTRAGEWWMPPADPWGDGR